MVSSDKTKRKSADENESKKPYRPSQEILNEYYLLSDLDKAKRYQGIISLLAKSKEEPDALDYCVERLVTGLASSRAAARIGYSTALTILVENVATKYTAEKLFEVADKKMDIDDESYRNANGIGHHLLATVLVKSGVYSSDFPQLLKRELVILKKFPALAMSVCHLVGEMLLAVDSKYFKANLSNPLKDYLESALQNSVPEFIQLILTIRKKHASVLYEKVSFLHKDGSCQFEVEDLEKILAAVRKCDKNFVNSFIRQIFEAARSGNQFGTVYKAIVERWACSGDESKVLERLLSTAEIALLEGKDHKEIINIFSDLLMKRITNGMSGKNSVQQRIVRAKISTFCNCISERLADVKDSEILFEIIGYLDRTGSFDQLIGNNFIEKLVSRLNETFALKWVQSLQDSQISRVGQVFRHWPMEVKKAIVIYLMSRQPSYELLMTVANAIDSLFYVKVRAGERVVFNLSEENETILEAAVNSIAEKDVKKALKKFTIKDLKTPMAILYKNIKIWEHLTQDLEDKKAYTQALEEIVAIASSEDEENVLIDLLISLLSRPHKFIRTIVYFVYIHLLPTIKISEVQHIIDSLLMNDAEIGTEENSSSESEEDDGTTEEDDDESEMDDGEIDSQFVSRIEEALGDAAVKRNADGDFGSDDSLSDMDDDTMFAMDERLANVFKAMNPRKAKSQKAQAMQEFRSKVTDLLLFTVSSSATPNNIKTNLIIPLLELSIVQLRREAQGTISKRTIDLLDMVSKQKMIASEKKTLKLLDQLVEKANLTNPILNSTIASLAAFIFSLGIANGEINLNVKSAFLDIFKKFLMHEEGSISSELATAAILKYPIYFASELATFFEAGFNEEIRIFRRMEALQCVVALLNKAVVKLHPVDKSSAKRLGKHISNYLNSVVAAPSEVKPRYFATVLKVLSTAATNLNDTTKESLAKNVSTTLEMIVEDDQLGKALKKCNSACSQICGKQAPHVVKAILKNLNTHD